MQHDLPEDPPDEVLEEQAKQLATRRNMWNNLLHPDPRDPDHVPKPATKPATKPKKRKEHNDGAE